MKNLNKYLVSSNIIALNVHPEEKYGKQRERKEEIKKIRREEGKIREKEKKSEKKKKEEKKRKEDKRKLNKWKEERREEKENRCNLCIYE